MTERLVEAPGDLVVDVIPVIDTEGDRGGEERAGGVGRVVGQRERERSRAWR